MGVTFLTNEDKELIDQEIDKLSEEKVNLPKDAEGNLITPTEGQTLLFRADGTTYYGTPTASGGNSGGTESNSHGIVWDLINISSSNNIVSVNDGASLVAVLTPSDGYSIGDVTITMGGEVVTGAWNVDTSTVMIANVTGDVVVSGVGLEQTGLADTSPVIAQENVGYGTSMTPNARENICITKIYEFTPDIDGIKASDNYDAENDYTLLSGTHGAITVCTPRVKYVQAGLNGTGLTTAASKIVLFRDGVACDYHSNSSLTNDSEIVEVKIQFNRYNTSSLYANGIAFSLSMLDIDESYAYWITLAGTVLPIGVRSGDIIFAGKNSPYYGMANIDGTIAGGESTTSELSFDDDFAMNYGIATTSILGEETNSNPETVYGLSSTFASVIDEARTAWMEEYGGDFRKIPIIVSTDQHGRRNSGIFNMLGKVLNMHDVSKVMNLGDTISTWCDADTTKPLLTDAGLDAWLESIKAIPYSKRLDVFGNHDTWYGNYSDEGNPIGTRYPSNQAHLNQYFRNIYARRTNNNGWFVDYDNQFNVKYVVVSGFEYQGGVTFRIGTAQMKFIIEEFNKDDGYDIVVVSHVPLWQVPASNICPTEQEASDDTTLYSVAAVDTTSLFNARKNRTSGTVTDSDGIEHSFDFTNCKTNLLCGLHGHMHYDAYNFVGGEDDGLMNFAFDWFDDNTFFFALIDRVSNQLNVWKVETPNGTPQYVNYQIPFNKPI